MGIDAGETQRTIKKSKESSRANQGWENSPPYRQLKVLLVEDDYSTRHVVAALLRNCGYQVVSAANGLQAWSLLLDEQIREFDLVLTDVATPGLSGVGLLSRIMHCERLKNVPVIMMSSHDSTDIVFKCLSKGAADFLVKPVRKNELKNLWQHSWRRRCQIRPSGSESEMNELTETKGEPEGMAVSCHSDNTQSSCTEKGVGAEVSANNAVLFRRGPQNKDCETDEDLEARVDMQEEEARPCVQTMVTDLQQQQQQTGSSVQLVADLIGNIATRQRADERTEVESDMGGSNEPEVLRYSSSDPASTSKLELSLRSSCAEAIYQHHEAANVFRQTGGASAFTRYTTIGNPRQQQQQSIQEQTQQECHQQDQQQQREEQQSVTGRREASPVSEVNRNGDGGMCSSAAAAAAAGERMFFCTPEQHQRMVNLTQEQQQQQPIQYATLVSYDHQSTMPGLATYYYAQPALAPWQHAFSPPQRREIDQQQQQQQQQQQMNFQAITNILAHHHHYQQQQQQQQQQNKNAQTEVSLVGREAPGCGSTNADDESGGGHSPFNNGLSGGSNGSMHGSNNGSNVLMNNNINIGGDSGSGNFSSFVAGSEQSRVRREAALNKFRLKRKERCFEKKVRYQSRKKLAEQRPRVRGQFVSQSVYNSSSMDMNS